MFKIICDEPHFVIVNKYAEYSLQQQAGQANWLEAVREATACPGLHLVHRLDRVTSGLLVLAKDALVAAELGAAFSSRTVEKFYIALANQRPTKKQGAVIGDMVAARGGSWRLARTRDNPAVTQFFSKAIGDGQRLFVLKPRTGKTHQLRVCLASLGSPILGDGRYKGTEADRCYLHAWQLGFTLAGQRYCFQALPDQGQHWLSPGFVRHLAEFDPPSKLTWPVIASTVALQGEDVG